jgi:4-hydroxy-tetrahydrodipicolinate reductase
MPNIRVAHVGLGPIGAAIAALVARRPGFTVVAAVDLDPQKVGRELGDVIGLDRRLRVRVQPDITKTLKTAKPHVVVHCTSSSLDAVLSQLEAIMRAKASIVSTTEELSYPTRSHRPGGGSSRCRREESPRRGTRTGVNPGFTMDALPDHADRRLRTRGPHLDQPDSGRAHPAPPVSAENWRRPDAVGVREEESRRQRQARRAR